MTKTPTRATKVLVITAVVTLFATGTAYAAGRGHKGAAKARSGVTAVEVARATSGTAASALSLSGSVVAASSLAMTAGTSGQISVLDVSVGQSVSAGQALMNVSNSVLQAQLASAQAAVGTAQAKLSAAEAPPSDSAVAVAADGVTKAQAVLGAAQSAYQQAVAASQAAAGQATGSPVASSKGGGSTAATATGSGQGSQAQLGSTAEALSVAQAGLTLAEAQAAQAQAPPSSAALAPLVAAVTQAQAAEAVIGSEIAQESLTAPFAGTVSSLSAVVGQTVTAGSTVLTLDGTGVNVQAPVSQANLSLVRDGESATLSVLGVSTNLRATITAVSPSASLSSLTFDVTLTPASPPPSWLHPGEAATALVVTSSTPTAVLVPASSIVSVNGHPQVFVVKKAHKLKGTHKGTRKLKGKKTHKGNGAKGRRAGGTVSLVNVTPSISDGSNTQVSGLSPGAAVVVAGQTYLAAGDRVRVTATLTVPTSVTGSSVGGILTAPPASSTGASAGAGTAGGGTKAGAGGGSTGKGTAGGAG